MFIVFVGTSLEGQRVKLRAFSSVLLSELIAAACAGSVDAEEQEVSSSNEASIGPSEPGGRKQVVMLSTSGACSSM